MPRRTQKRFLSVRGRSSKRHPAAVRAKRPPERARRPVSRPCGAGRFAVHPPRVGTVAELHHDPIPSWCPPSESHNASRTALSQLPTADRILDKTWISNLRSQISDHDLTARFGLALLVT